MLQVESQTSKSNAATFASLPYMMEEKICFELKKNSPLLNYMCRLFIIIATGAIAHK